MASIKEKRIGSKTYYYLEHSFRSEGRVEKREVYLGAELPENLEELKEKLVSEVDKEKWFEQFNRIKRNFSAEQGELPISAMEKETETFAVKFTYNTNRIEGSKLTLRETANLLEKGISPGQKPVRDIKEAEAHRDVFYEMLHCKKDLSLQIVLYWHKKLFERTKQDVAGRIRAHQVAISGSKFMPPSPAEVYALLTEFFKWYDKNKKKLHPVELAGLVHLKFVTIHPFADGNGRISRILMNFVLQKNGFPMLDIPYENRDGYYNALEKAHIQKDDKRFLNWFFGRYMKEHKKYLKK